jgi:hypothetical protein
LAQLPGVFSQVLFPRGGDNVDLIETRADLSQTGEVKLHQALDVTGIGVWSEMNIPFVEETASSLTVYYIAPVKSKLRVTRIGAGRIELGDTPYV